MAQNWYSPLNNNSEYRFRTPAFTVLRALHDFFLNATFGSKNLLLNLRHRQQMPEYYCNTNSIVSFWLLIDTNDNY